MDDGEDDDDVFAPARVPVRGGLFDVDVAKREAYAVFWDAEPLKVMRATWFIATNVRSRGGGRCLKAGRLTVQVLQPFSRPTGRHWRAAGRKVDQRHRINPSWIVLADAARHAEYVPPCSSVNYILLAGLPHTCFTYQAYAT